MKESYFSVFAFILYNSVNYVNTLITFITTMTFTDWKNVLNKLFLEAPPARTNKLPRGTKLIDPHVYYVLYFWDRGLRYLVCSLRPFPPESPLSVTGLLNIISQIKHTYWVWHRQLYLFCLLVKSANQSVTLSINTTFFTAFCSGKSRCARCSFSSDAFQIPWRAWL